MLLQGQGKRTNYAASDNPNNNKYPSFNNAFNRFLIPRRTFLPLQQHLTGLRR